MQKNKRPALIFFAKILIPLTKEKRPLGKKSGYRFIIMI